MSVSLPFKWRQLKGEIILLCVRWYLRHALSYRDLEFLLCAKCDSQAVKRFFAKMLKADHTVEPRVINNDQNAAYPPAYDALREEEQLPGSCTLRQCK